MSAPASGLKTWSALAARRRRPSEYETVTHGLHYRTRNPDAFLHAIEGVVVGDSVEQGIVRGNAFAHPMMRIALEFPDGWEVANTAEQVMARLP